MAVLTFASDAENRRKFVMSKLPFPIPNYSPLTFPATPMLSENRK